MAEKEKKPEEKKQIKIISERVNQQFKEIEKESDEEEKESLEEEIEEAGRGEEAENFSSGGRIAPVLQTSTAGTEPIEKTIENAPPTKREGEDEIKYSRTRYEMSGYDRGYEPDKQPRVEIKRAGESRLHEPALNLNQFAQKTQQEWDFRDREKTGSEARKYQEVKRALEEERRTPFSRREERKRKVF